MKLIEQFTDATGTVFEISSREGLEPHLGDYESLFFQVAAPNRDDYEPWGCIIKINGTVLAIWKKLDSDIYEILLNLGVLKIKAAIKKDTKFSEYLFEHKAIEPSLEKEMDRLRSEI